MDSIFSPFDFRWLPIEKLRPNPWNPNRMSAELSAKLRAAIAERGMLGALVVRPREDYFEVVDGEHRWRIARELGLTEVPCLVVPLSDSEAKLKTLQLNGLRGENDPELLARLLLDLSLEFQVSELAGQLPYSELEIESSLELLKLKEENLLAASVPAQWEEEARREIFAVVVAPEERAVIEGALALLRGRHRESSRGSALAWICRAYLERPAD